MMTRLTFAALVFTMSTASFAQNTLGVTDFQPDLVEEGYNLIYPHNQPNVYLLDMCGEVVHSWTNADSLRPGNMAYLQENGDIVMTYRHRVFADDPIWAGGGGATIERRTWDNDVIWSFTLNDSTARLHHDIEVKPDGNVFAIAWEHFSAEEALQAGRDTSIIPEGGLWSEMVLELAPDTSGGAIVVWEWHAWDHLVQDYDATKDNFGVVSDQIDKIDLNYGTPSSQPSDWLHINAIDYDPYFNHLLLSVPTFDELWIVDYANFTPGKLLWRWGNPEAHGQGSEDDKKLFYQHDCHWIYDNVAPGTGDFGKIAVFNNRVPTDSGDVYSAAHVLNPSYADYDNSFGMDASGDTYLPLDFDWTYVAPDSIYSSGLSSFQRLGNGNSLICYGRWGDTREVTPEGDLAWRYKTPLVNAGGFASPVSQGTEPAINQNMTFRAHRYPMDFDAFADVDLTPQGPIELDPMPLAVCQSCDSLSVSVATTTDTGLGNGSATATATGGDEPYSYAWYTADSDSSFAEGMSIDSLLAGAYSVLVVDSAGCSGSSAFVIDATSSIDDETRIWKVFPNPANDVLNVTVNTDGQGTLRIFDVTGRVVLAHTITSNSTSLDLTSLTSGSYVLSVEHGTSTVTRHIHVVR